MWVASRLSFSLSPKEWEVFFPFRHTDRGASNKEHLESDSESGSLLLNCSTREIFTSSYTMLSKSVRVCIFSVGHSGVDVALFTHARMWMARNFLGTDLKNNRFIPFYFQIQQIYTVFCKSGQVSTSVFHYSSSTENQTLCSFVPCLLFLAA